jgi:hypothetical protein
MLRLAPVALLALSCVALLAPRGAETVPLYAARAGMMCESCHFDPNGGGPRNEFGFMYARQRHEIVPEAEGSPWTSLELTNRVGDSMPLYVGVNHRFMLLGNTSLESDSLDRLGFFNMENALHLTFKPHDRLALVYTRDGFNAASSSQEAFGMISGFPWNGYLKAGRIRAPFGLRMDDHTVATRNAFLDFANGEVFLPYDPRNSDMGLEYGMEKSGVFGRAAWLNGDTSPFGQPNNRAQTVVAKLGYNHARYQGAISFYDDFHDGFDFSSFPPGTVGERSTRWGYYGMTHWKQFALLGEVAGGTDKFLDPLGSGGQAERNSFAGWVELDYAPSRTWNLRLRYDQLVYERSPDIALRDANTHERWALEGEIVPVPFAQIRWTLRHIDHKDNDAYGFEDEDQAYVQFHFSY